MDRKAIADAFDKFENEKYADSEDILRGEIKQAVNDHIKDILNLKKDPIVSPSETED